LTRGAKDQLRTLWLARLRAGVNNHDMYFRSTEEAIDATLTAQKLIDESAASNIAGAVIVAVTRIARLWN